MQTTSQLDRLRRNPMHLLLDAIVAEQSTSSATRLAPPQFPQLVGPLRRRPCRTSERGGHLQPLTSTWGRTTGKRPAPRT
jgi:hypothetical protein